MTSDPIVANDAEISLLGAAMSGYNGLDDLLELVQAGDFYHPFHGSCWDAIGRVRHAGNVPDAVKQAAVQRFLAG